MIASAENSMRIVLYEGNGSRPLSGADRFQLLRTLLEKGYSISRVRPDGQLADQGHGQLVVLGKFDQRPPEFDSNDSDTTVRTIDIQDLTVDSIVQQLEDIGSEANRPGPGGWKPWFPVIDFSRCTNCMQCLSFCLFDVYGVTSAGQITVQNETKCKTDCPACSRVCPEVAILFPKYKAGPINGDEVSDDDVRREAMKVDISSLLGGDIYSLLRDRSAKAKSRFSKERDDDRALKERQRCMQALQKEMGDMDIPADILANLPSMAEIKDKAEQAKQKAQAALDQQAKK